MIAENFVVAENYSTDSFMFIPFLSPTSASDPRRFETKLNNSATVIDLSFIAEEKEKMKNLDKLRIIKQLKPNWNNNEAEPFSNELINSCEHVIRHIIKQPELFPTARQSIQFEYEKENGDYLELELFEDKVNILIMNYAGDESEEVLPVDMNKINKVVSDFYG